MPALTWSSQLAADAQEWANGCKPEPDDSTKFAHSETGGENLAWGTGLSGTGSVDLWYSEMGKYNFASPSWSNNIAHFAQVVWRNSTQIGCAMASCSGLNYWVCRYSPPGNFNVKVPGQLAENVPTPCGERVTKPPFIKPGDVSKPQDLGIVPKPPAGADIFKQMKP